MAQELRLLGISVERDYLNESRRPVRREKPVVRLTLALPSGAIRQAPLNEGQLLKLIEDSAAALRILKES